VNKIDILYLIFFDVSGPAASAPVRRALALKNAFSDTMMTVCISGKPLKRFFRILKFLILQKKPFESVYIENSSTTLYPLDFLLLYYFKIRQKKIGIFIRDAHPLFPEFVCSLKWYQHILYKSWHYSMQFLIHNVPIWFVPSERFGTFLQNHYRLDRKLPRISVLPPAMTENTPQLFDEKSKNVLYVGGISKRYGLDNILRLSDLLYELDNEAKIMMLIRHKPAQLIERSNIGILHGDLSVLYKNDYRFRFSVMLLEPNAYNTLAFPVKMMDYLSMGLPVVSTPIPEAESFLLSYKTGIIIHDYKFPDIKNLWDDADFWKGMNENISGIKNQFWTDRCSRILDILSSPDSF
jgi:glycosyltransferase involved in cell wall biosynthesis